MEQDSQNQIEVNVRQAIAVADPTGHHIQVEIVTPQNRSLHIPTARRASYASSNSESDADQELFSEEEHDSSDVSEENRMLYRSNLNPRVNTPLSREQANTATEHSYLTQITVHFDGDSEHQRRYRQVVERACEQVEVTRITRLVGSGPQVQQDIQYNGNITDPRIQTYIRGSVDSAICEAERSEGHIQIQIERQQGDTLIRESPPMDTAFTTTIHFDTQIQRTNTPIPFRGWVHLSMFSVEISLNQNGQYRNEYAQAVQALTHNVISNQETDDNEGLLIFYTRVNYGRVENTHRSNEIQIRRCVENAIRIVERTN